MELIVEYVDIKGIVLADHNAMCNGILTLDTAEMLDMIASPIFASVALEVTHPGESCRISRAGDVIQPMIKLDCEEATFPGMIGDLRPVGCGRTRKLRGAAVVETYDMFLPRNHFIDMSGPCASYTPFSQTVNLVILAKPIEGADKFAYGEALKRASLLLAKKLAAATLGVAADDIQVFTFRYNSESELFGQDLNRLPRVAYVHQYLAASEQIEQTFYGKGYYTSLPTLFHPLEFLDGAIISKNFLQSMNAEPTYFLQNHPYILELLSRHGKDLNFTGIVYCHTPWSSEDKRRNAMMAVSLVKNVLKAEAVAITKEGGGHPQIDVSHLCDFCEQQGIKTQVSLFELNTTSGSCEEVLLFFDPRVDAIGSFGCLEAIELPVMDRVIGSLRMAGAQKPLNEPGNVMNNWDIRGAMSQIGAGHYTSIKY